MCMMNLVHMTFSSFSCDFEDTAQYRVSAMNSEGELSAFASVVVKSTSHPVFKHQTGLHVIYIFFSLSLHTLCLVMSVLGFKGEVDEFLPAPRR